MSTGDDIRAAAAKKPMRRYCVYCGAPERENTKADKCRDGFPHCFQFEPSDLRREDA